MAVALRLPDFRAGLLCGHQCGEEPWPRCGDCAQAFWSFRRRWPSRPCISQDCLSPAVDPWMDGTVINSQHEADRRAKISTPVPPPRFFLSCGSSATKADATLADGKQLATVCRIKPLRRLHCCALPVLCWGGAGASATRQPDVRCGVSDGGGSVKGTPRPAVPSGSSFFVW